MHSLAGKLRPRNDGKIGQPLVSVNSDNSKGHRRRAFPRLTPPCFSQEGGIVRSHQVLSARCAERSLISPALGRGILCLFRLRAREK